MTLLTCPQCNYLILTSDKFCRNCGFSLISKKKTDDLESKKKADDLEDRVGRLEELTDTPIIKGGFMRRAFAIWGYMLVAQFIVTVIAYLLYFLLIAVLVTASR
jgi:hypothetical protein